jgi:hypothetical protein
MAEASLPIVPSSKATYSGQRTQGVIVGRSKVEVSPKFGGEFSPGDLITLEVPSQAWLDPCNFFIEFRTSIIAGENTNGISATEENVLPYQTTDNNRHPHLKGANDRRTFEGQVYPELNDKTVQFLPGIQTIISRMRLLSGSVVLEDIRDYNVLYRLLTNASATKNWTQGDGFTSEGFYDIADMEQVRQNANFHSTLGHAGSPIIAPNEGRFYTIRPLLGLLNARKYIPLKFMEQLTIEIYLEQPGECMRSTVSARDYWTWGANTGADVRNVNSTQSWATIVPGSTKAMDSRVDRNIFESFYREDWHGDASEEVLGVHQAVTTDTGAVIDFPQATYRVRDVRMYCHFVFPSAAYDRMIRSQIESPEGLDIWHNSWNTHTRNISSVGLNTLSFQERVRSLKGGLFAMRNSLTIADIRHDFAFPANGMKSYQFQVGSEFLPQQEVGTHFGGSRAYQELKKTLGIFGETAHSGLISEKNYLPHNTPPQMDNLDLDEIRAKSSLPSTFMLGLHLEKSIGQFSGYDSSLSAVDVQLHIDLRPHTEMVGVNSNPTTFDGALDGVTAYKPNNGSLAGTTWQPTKYWVNNYLYTIPYVEDSTVALGRAASWNAATENMQHSIVTTTGTSNWANFPVTSVLINKDGPGGHMKAQDVVAVHPPQIYLNTWGDNNVVTSGDRDLVLTLNTTEQYARGYFFAHYDQRLKLTGIGRLMISR